MTSLACGDDEPGAAHDPASPTTLVEGIPVLEDATQDPGTELGAGFTVAEGSVLLGDAFPIDIGVVYEGVPLEDRGFYASLLVTGDARAVLEAYAQQAAAIGLPLSNGTSLGLCADDDVGDAFTCTAGATQGPTDAGRSVRLLAWRAPASGDRAPLSHLFLHYSELGEPPFDDPVTEVRDHGPGVGNPPIPRDWPSLPQVGEPYESAVAQPPLRVERGTELVAHPSLSGLCGNGGSTAVFRVGADPREVLEALAAQPGGGAFGDEPSIQRTVEGDATLLRTSWTNGGSYSVVTVRRPDEPTWMLVDHCTTD